MPNNKLKLEFANGWKYLSKYCNVVVITVNSTLKLFNVLDFSYKFVKRF